MNTQKRILVVGGTGAIGQPVAAALQKAGFAVSVLTRDPARAELSGLPGVDYVQGDVADAASLRAALEGCYGAHISLQSGQSPEDQERIQHQGTKRIAQAAAAVGVQHITYVSGYLVSERFAYIPAEKAKLDAENAIKASGVTYTIFRPTYFMDVMPRFVQNGRMSVFGKQPHPIHFLAVADFAKFVAAAYSEPQAANQTFYVRGTQALTFAEAFELYRQATDPALKVSVTPFWIGGMINRLVLKGGLTETLALLRATNQVGEIGDYAPAEQVFGVAPTTVESWLRR
ncbi:MAG: NmrA family NAD(P)-binding protein [Anaerolineaceae bacterium]|nr:NmrA family NAD(P)-binding protein [Anaerolineaceae bacterium]